MQGRNPKQIEKERVGRVNEKPSTFSQRHVSSLEPTESLLIGPNHVVMHRLVEMGYFGM